MKRKSPASGKRQGLDNDFDEAYSSTNPHKLHTRRNRQKTLARIARKWAARGYYPTPSEAMVALLGGCHE
jgi:hypothetical protein